MPDLPPPKPPVDEEEGAEIDGPGWKLLYSGLDLKVTPSRKQKREYERRESATSSKKPSVDLEPGVVREGRQQPLQRADETEPTLLRADRNTQIHACADMLEGKLSWRSALLTGAPILLIPWAIVFAIVLSSEQRARSQNNRSFFIPLLLMYILLTAGMVILPLFWHIFIAKPPLLWKYHRWFHVSNVLFHVCGVLYVILMCALLHGMYREPAWWAMCAVLLVWGWMLFYGTPVRLCSCPFFVCGGVRTFRRAAVRYSADADRIYRQIRDRRFGNGKKEATPEGGERKLWMWHEDRTEVYYVDTHGKLWQLPDVVPESGSAPTAADKKQPPSGIAVSTKV